MKAGTEPLEAVLALRLIRAAEQLDGESVGDPLMVAGLQAKLGESLLNLGFAEGGIRLFQKAREIRTAKLGANNPETLESAEGLARCYKAAGKLDIALPLFEELLKLNLSVFGSQHANTLRSMSNLASCQFRAGRLDLAIPLYEKNTPTATGHTRRR